MKALRIFTALILIGGVCLTGRAAYLHAKAELAGILIRRAWETTLRTGESSPPWPWADAYPIARLQIPRLGYDEMVLEGATPRTLAFGPARLLSGAGLGEPGNLLVAGHRTSWFRQLEGIVAGDTIQLQWLDSHGRLQAMNYKVGVIRIVDPQDVTLLAPTSEEALTLITCYPFGSSPYSPQRFMVRAYPVGPSRGVETESAVTPEIAKR
jgi:sortase A